MKDLLLIKCNVSLSYENFEELYNHLMDQKERGLIIIPSYCEALIVPDEIKIKVDNEKGK